MAIPVVEQASAVGGSPERAILSSRKRVNVVASHSGRVGTGIDDEADAVKSYESSGRADPQISIRCLGNGANSVFGKPVLRSPDPAHVGCGLRLRGRRGESLSKRYAGESQQYPACAQAASKVNSRMRRSTLHVRA